MQDTPLLAAELENEEGDGDSSSADGGDASLDPGLLREMIAAGLCYGRSKAKTHPRMKPFIFASRNGTELIDVAQTWHAFLPAQKAVKETAAAGRQILFVGTQPSAQESVLATAQKLGYPYVVNRWLGGTLTNFKTISRRVEHFKKLKADRASGLLEKYTKKERLGIDRTIEKMDIVFRGIEHMGKLPGLLVVVNANLHETAIREARRAGIPVLAVMNSDADPLSVDYPVPANDNSQTSTQWLLAKIEAAAEEGKAEAEAKRQEQPNGKPAGTDPKAS